MKIGVIGLGEVAQLMHLPILQDLGDKFQITAVSDVSPSLVGFIKDKYHVPQGYLSAPELIEKSDTEAVFVLSPDQYHGEYIELALKAGKHVFVEKPVALASKEVERLITLAKEHPKSIVMVGYMRRFADHFLKAKELMELEPKKTEYLRFRDIICEGPFYIGQTRPIFYPKDVPQDVIDESRARRRQHLDMAIGADATDEQRTTYQMMTGLGCHSISAVRELFGVPKAIKSVATACGGTHVVVVMEYDGFLGVYELLNDQDIVEFDAAIEIYQHTRKLKVKYETPYVRYQPMSLEVIDSTKTDTKTTVFGPSWRDPFQTELSEFYACIAENRQPKTTLADALEDLKLFEEIIAAVKRGGK
ncbi:Gfo/Idh/MocA family protein [Breznakiella homolactica]|uniref:Gfo/Idh/MocA family oxidoreductase n=1 Tax=Breznakiella homolactica TaxID=2798577 RepID=A0A7T7XMK6_9SPIR|nr:Gfo/Idh/MocA family oxidoreductase [Breznakiella homolactica]QQO09136.1 Gfo/Idh/MocA family oxidoreductase [Breznakiella homolactica]